MDVDPNGTSVTQERSNKKPRLDSEFASSFTTILEHDDEPGLYEGDDISESQSSVSFTLASPSSFSGRSSFPMSPTQGFSGIPGLTLISGERTEEQVKQDVARSMEMDITSPPRAESENSLKRHHPEDSSEDVRMTSPMPPSAEQKIEENGDREKTPIPTAAKTEDTEMKTEENEEDYIKMDAEGEEEFRFDSSDGSDSDDESSSSDDDSEDESDEEMTLMDPKELARKLMEGTDEDAEVNDAPPKTKHELEEEYIPIPDIKVTENAKLEELGTVSSIVGTLLLIKAKTSGEYQVLNEKSVLATAEKKVFGVVYDTIGRVEEPLYTVRFNSTEQIKEFGLAPGKPVYYLPEHSTYVFTKPLMGQKGSDASNLFDEEVPEHEQEFSDDEKEAARKREKKKKPGQGDGAKGRGSKFDYESTLPPPAAPDDEPYVPLTRPAHLPNKPAPPPPRPAVDTSRSYNNGRDNRRGGGRGGRGGWNGRDHSMERNYGDQRRGSAGYTSNQQSPQRSPIAQDNRSNQAYPSYGQWSPPQQQQQQQQPPAQSPQSASFSQSFLPQALYAAAGQSPPVTPFTPPALPPGAHINPAFFRNLSAPTTPTGNPYPPQAQQFNWQQPPQQAPQWPGVPAPNSQAPQVPAYPAPQQSPSQSVFPTPWLQSSVSPPPLQQPVPIAVPTAPSPNSTSTAPIGKNDEAFKKIQDKLAILSQLGGI